MKKEVVKRATCVMLTPSVLVDLGREAEEMGLSQSVLVERLIEEFKVRKEEKKGKVPEGFWVEREGGKRMFVGRVGKRFYVSQDEEAWPVGDWTAIEYWEQKQKALNNK